MDTAGWYEIHVIGYASGKEHGVVNQPVPPNVGDRINLHHNSGNVVEVLSRTFDYTKGLYVTIEVAFV